MVNKIKKLFTNLNNLQKLCLLIVLSVLFFWMLQSNRPIPLKVGDRLILEYVSLSIYFFGFIGVFLFRDKKSKL